MDIYYNKIAGVYKEEINTSIKAYLNSEISMNTLIHELQLSLNDMTLLPEDEDDYFEEEDE